MALLFWLLAYCYAGDVGQLGHPSFERRDAAHRRLAQAGPLALPAVLPGLSSPDPEIAYRCDRLIRPWQVRQAQLAQAWYRAAAAALLTAPGWCGEREAELWIGQGDAIDAAARRLKLLPSHWDTGPWYCSQLSPVDQVRAMTNWCRSQHRKGPLVWAWPWSDFVIPRTE